MLTQSRPSNQDESRTYAPVRNLVLYLTDDCNLRCFYCFVKKGSRRMSSETARKAVDFLLSRTVSGALRRLGITFFGGEPFLELERMKEVMEYARIPRSNVYKCVAFSATTNGTLATPEVERLVKDHRMSLLVSMDGSQEASSYRPFASGPSSWSTVAENLPKLVEWSESAVVRMTFHPGALRLAENVQAALDLGARSVALCPVVDAPWHEHSAALERAFDELGDRFLEEARSGRLFPLEITCMLLREFHEARLVGGRPDRPCAVGKLLVSVDPDGNVMPCHRFLDRPQEWLGRVEDAQLSPERMRYVHLSSGDIPGCEGCPATPVCGGGCRIVPMNSGRALTEAHPGHCAVMRAHARVVGRIYKILSSEQSPVLAGVLRSTRPIPLEFPDILY